MAIELHHLNTHGMMEQAGKVLDGVARLKQRIAELEKENADLRSKNEGLLYALADAETDLAMLQRWRKCSEELPEKGQKVLFRAKYKTDNIRTWIGEFHHHYGEVFYASAPGWGCEFLPNEIFGWIPLPSAPKEEKK